MNKKLTLFLILTLVSSNTFSKSHKKKMYSEEQCLVSAIIYEAGGEGIKGMKSVMQVIRNRARIRELSVCQVVFEPKQFSWVGKKKIVKKLTEENLELLSILEEMPDLFGKNSDKIEYFHSTKIKPKWAKTLNYVGKIGKHRFYKRK